MLLLPVVRELGLLRRRKIRLALVSDDVQYARAKSVAAARGDAPDYWKNVREAERVLYGHPDVEVVLSISDDDSRAFEEVRASPQSDVSADFVGHELLKKETLTAAKPPIRVLPFRARIDPQTARKGWDAHAQTWGARKDLVFVGGGTYSNRRVVRWLLREALPAISSLSDVDGGCDELRNAQPMLAGTVVWAEEARAACKDAIQERCGSNSACARPKTSGEAGRPTRPRGSGRPARLDNVGNVAGAAPLRRRPTRDLGNLDQSTRLALERRPAHRDHNSTAPGLARRCARAEHGRSTLPRPVFAARGARPRTSPRPSPRHTATRAAGATTPWRPSSWPSDLESRSGGDGPDGPLADLGRGARGHGLRGAACTDEPSRRSALSRRT